MGDKLKSLAKQKAKAWVKKIIMMIMIPWGTIALIAIICISCIWGTLTSFWAGNTFNETFTKEQNSTIHDYLSSAVKQANGEQDDHFGIAKKIGLTDGDVAGYLSLAEMETGKDIQNLVQTNNAQDTAQKMGQTLGNGSGSTDSDPAVASSEAAVDKYVKELAPTFKYDTVYTITTTTTVTDTKGKCNVTVIVKKDPMKVLTYADTIKGAANITYKTTVTSDNTTTTQRTYTQPIQAAQPNSAPTGTIGVNTPTLTPVGTPTNAATNNSNKDQQLETITETTSVETKVETPNVDKITQSGGKLARLKAIIKKDFPNENTDDNLLMSCHMVMNGGSKDYNNKEENGDWINEEPNDDITLDILDAVNGDNDGFCGNIPLFRQTDPRWANQPYGQGTIATSGCGPTSFAMVISGLGGNLGQWDLNHDNILDPGEAAKYAIAEGYNSSSGAGTSWGLFDQASTSRFGVNSSGEIEPSNYSYVYQQLQAGNPVIASMGPGVFTKGGHFIVLTGVDSDGQVLINDPNPNTGINKYPMDKIAAEARMFWVFTNPNMQGTTFKCTVYGGQQDAMEGGGTTANGINTNSMTDASARIIAVDPNVIPLGKKVYLRFPEGVRHQQTSNGQPFDLDGWYTAADTGGAIKGNHIDLFCGWGSFAQQLISKIGTRSVQVVKK